MPVRISSNILSKKQSGLSLLELLVVVSILAAIAGIGVQVYGDTDQQVQLKLSVVELQVVANAVRRFKQDTGYYPKDGPFDLDAPPRIGQVSLDTLPDYVPGPAAKKIAWFDSPANLSQLITAPVDMNDNPIMPWNVETGKGWRGPYLSSTKLCYMDLSDDLSRAGFGDFSDELGGLLKNVPVLPDVISNNPAVPVSIAYDPDEYLVDCRRVLTTSTAYETSLHELGRIGSPYLLFLYDIDEGGTNHPKPKVVMVGPNGVFDGTDGGEFIDGTLRYSKEDWCAGVEDDVVICL